MRRVSFPQCASRVSSEYIRGVWTTESSDTGRWIEVVVNLVSNSNSWMVIDKTNKWTWTACRGGKEIIAGLLRTYTDKTCYHCIGIRILLRMTPVGAITFDPKFMYCMNLAWRELCFILNCELSHFPPGWIALLTPLTKGGKIGR